MKITTEKKQTVKLYDWLKAKKLSLKDFLLKKDLKSYSQLVDYCNNIGLVPCTEHDFDKSYIEINPPKPIEIVPVPQYIEEDIIEEKETQEESTTPKQRKNKTG